VVLNYLGTRAHFVVDKFRNVGYIRNMIKTYTEAQVRAALATLVLAQSYRKAADSIGEDVGNFFRMVNGTTSVSERAADAIGFVPVDEPKLWQRKESK